ncbi:MAG: ATP-binding protein [Opitutaceae bacterium]|nr:ATP-binding protein [Opitutaceae bacterium]
MKRIIRILGLALGLLLLFLASLVFTNSWLRQQNEQLLRDTLHSRAAQFADILALAKAGPPPWTPELADQLSRALDAEILVLDTPPSTAQTPRPSTTSIRWRFNHSFLNADGLPEAQVQVVLAPPPTVRAMALLQRVSAVLLSFALLLLLVLILLVVIDRRWLRSEDTTEASAPGAPSGEFTVLSHLAARSARQSVELEQERSERQRAEADSHLNQVLLNRALQEKINMGRDLHDGLIQSLYATGLTIQAGRRALTQDPAEARNLIETALQTLNAAIREVREYISGLAPEKLQERSFADSVQTLAHNLAAGRPIDYDLRIDEEAARHIPPDHVTDLLQIVREAISNSLRHGGARHISVRLHRHGNAIALLVHDNGSGFDIHRAERGHGRDNMQARAARLGATLRCNSEAGVGTRIVVEFSAPPLPENP